MKADFTIQEQIPEAARVELNEYSDTVAHLLYHRNILTKNDAQTFFSMKYDEQTHDPMLLHNMDKAIDRILSAIEQEQKIAIYADYDADGIPGAVILYDFFRKIGYENNTIVYIPHRNKEGFGLNKTAVQSLADDNVDLIITIDCGITDVAEVELANELGMDVIITDHHVPHDDIPKAVAIVNPKQKECQYPFKELCGSGVIFKVVTALVSAGRERDIKNFVDVPQGWEKTLLDMVGVATLSDMVSLTGENRLFAQCGLTVLKMSKRPGLHKLFRKTYTNQKTLTEDDVVFTITPRINAASRMGVPKSAFEMLVSNNEVEAGELVNHLHQINEKRKGSVAAIVKEVNAMCQKNPKILESPVIVVGNVSWQPSLMGLVANSLSEKTGKPAFLWGRGDGHEIKGSCRSRGVSVVELMKRVPEGVLLGFGGHVEAGGFEITHDQVDFLRDGLNAAHEAFATDAVTKEEIADMFISIDAVDHALLQQIETLAPYGMDNTKPIFVSDINVHEVEIFGKQKNHLRLMIKQSNGKLLPIISFFDTKDGHFEKGKTYTISYHIERDTFGRNNSIRMRLVNIH